MKKETPALKRRSATLLFLFFLIAITVSSCKNTEEKKETATADNPKPATTIQNETGDTATAAAYVNYPIFRVDKDKLTRVHGKIPKKLLIKFKHANLSNAVGSVTLLLYSTKTHKDYATDDDPMEVSDRSLGTKSIPKDMVLGNNELNFKKLLKENGDLEDFSYFSLTPDIYKDAQGLKHLVFKVEFYDSQNKLIKATYTEDFLTKPSPPARPIDD